MTRQDENLVLIVNDAPEQLELMSLMLSRVGYNVLTAADGREGFAAARRARRDLVISDVRMLLVDGIELCRMIRAQPGLSTTPLLLVSAERKDSRSVVEGLEADADDYLEAPYDPAQARRQGGAASGAQTERAADKVSCRCALAGERRRHRHR